MRFPFRFRGPTSSQCGIGVGWLRVPRLSQWTILCLANLCLTILGTAGCGTRPPTDTLLYARGGDAQTLDPIHTDVGESVKVLVNLYDTLVTYADDSLELVPGLAEHWEVDDTGKHWTFRLRAGITFHDGTPCDANAVVFSLQRLSSSQPEHVYHAARPYQPSFQGIESLEVVDPLTVRCHLREPSAVFLNNLAMFCAGIVSPTAVKTQQGDFGNHPVGSGPFRLLRWNRDQEIVLEAFPQHWRGKPGVQRAIFLPIAEPTTRVAQLKRGEVHIADNLPPTELQALQGVPGIEQQEQPGLNVGYLSLHTEKPPLNVLEVRQAIALAIDKTQLIRVAYAGQAQPAVTLVPPTMWGHHATLKDLPCDLEQASRLMTQAAKDHSFSLPVKLQLFVMDRPRPYMQQPLETATFIRDALVKIGIELEIVQSDINLHFERIMAGEHQLALAGWSSDNADPDNFLYVLLDTDNIGPSGNNLSRYRNESVHTQLLAAQRELNRERRSALYAAVQEQVLKDVPVVPLVHTNVQIALRTEVRDYRLHPSSLVFLRAARLGAPRP